jgi:hypothetical protein
MTQTRTVSPWKTAAFVLLFSLSSISCAPGAVLYKLALYAGELLLSSVVAKTVEMAFDQLFVPSKSKDQPTAAVIVVDPYDPLRGTYHGKLVLKAESSGKTYTLESPRMIRDNESANWRIHQNYLNEVRDGLK